MKRLNKKLIGLNLAPVVVLAAVASAVPWALKRRMSPSNRDMPFTPADLGLAGREIWLDGARDKKLHGWWIPVGHDAPAVVVLHGWGANSSLMLPFAAPLHAAGFHTFLVDARGHGFSDTDDYSSMPRFAEDLDVALDWVHANGRVGDVGVIGHSIGAGAAAMAVGGRDDIGAFVSVAGVADVWQVMVQHPVIGRMPTPAEWALRKTMEQVVGTTFAEVAPEQVLQNVSVPTMIVHGDADEIVPIDHAYRLAEARGDAELLIVPGGRHGDLTTFESHIGPILGFLSAHLG